MAQRILLDEIKTTSMAIECIVGKVIDVARAVDSGNAKEIENQEVFYRDLRVALTNQWGVYTKPYDEVVGRILGHKIEQK